MFPFITSRWLSSKLLLFRYEPTETERADQRDKRLGYDARGYGPTVLVTVLTLATLGLQVGTLPAYSMRAFCTIR